ncbi:MAG: hypothetical protein GWP07_07535 [Xanthomonadaceae bacterium]|nr:hypothetical protein [Xanthomonadaceae bacterium]
MALAHSRRPSMAGLWGALKQCPRRPAANTAMSQARTSFNLLGNTSQKVERTPLAGTPIQGMAATGNKKDA